VDVVLVRSADGRSSFLSAGPIPREGQDAPRSRAERCARGLQAGLLLSGKRLGPRLKRARDWLNSWGEADDTMLADLRRAEWLRVRHPADLDDEEAAQRWVDYLRERQRHHLARLFVNLLISPITVILAPLPGPNVVGYWFVYRAILHGMVLQGLRRATSKRSLSTRYEADAALDQPLASTTFDKLVRAAARHRGPRFESLLHEALGTVPAVRLVKRPPARPARPIIPETWHPWLSIIPNALTVSRLVLAVVFPLAGPEWWLKIYLASAATEFLDGQLSRRLHATTLFGRILDPIADKLFVVSVLATLWYRDVLMGWMIPLIAARDLLVLLGALWVLPWEGLGSMRRMPPSWLGKVATAAQFLFLLLAIVRGRVDALSLGLTATLSIAAGIDYIRRFR
jgi:phosphatidylglycerophosphate synthase